MGFLTGLKKKVEGVVAQVNPLDNGRTYSTVMQHGSQFAPKAPASVFQQATHNGVSNVLGGAVKAPIQFANTANLAGHELFDTGKMLTANATHNPTAFSNASRQANQHWEQLGKQNSGLFGQGTFFKSPTEARSGSFKIVAPKIAGGTLQTAASVIPVGGGVLAKGSLGMRAAKGAAAGAVSGGAFTAGSDLIQEGRINPLNVVKGAGMGAALGGATPLAGRAIKMGVQKTPEVAQGAQRVVNPMNAQITDHISTLEKSKAGRSLTAQKQIDNAIAKTIQERARINRKGGVGGEGLQLPRPGSGNTGRVPSRSAGKANLGSGSYKGSIAPDLQALRPDAVERVMSQNPFAPSDLQTPISKLSENLPPQRAFRISNPESLKDLPEFNTHKVGIPDKAFRSTRSIIERQGSSGKELAGNIQSARDVEELYQAHLLKQLPTVRSLKGKDYENFVDATQGLAEASKPKIAAAVKEWQTLHPSIRERAVGAGLDVGDLGQTYYPHFVDYGKIFKDKNMYNQAINHLVGSGQAATPEEAITLLSHARDISRNRKFGNLEASREVDLPFYDKSPNSLTSYLQGSAKRIAQTETFGKGDEESLKLITKIAKEGYDAEAAKNAYDIAVGAKQHTADFKNGLGNVRRYMTTTRLGLGALTNTSQSVNTGVVTGHIRTLGAMMKQLSPKTRAFVEDTGTISDAVINDIREQTGFTGKVLSKITAPGFGKVEKFNRSVAATSGRDYALRLVQKGDETTLRRLGVTGPIKNKTLTEAQQIQAARKVVEKTQFKVDPQDLPGWADSPGGKLVAQFRTFSYNQSKFFSNEILKPAAKGNLMPLTRLLAALPVGYALYETKRAIAGRPEETNPIRKGSQIFSTIGGAGLVVDVFNGLIPLNNKTLTPERRVSMAVGTFGGPAAGTASEFVGALSNAAPKILSGTGDATQLTRFSIRQAPIVGTAIQNRVLPYKSAQGQTGGDSSVASSSDRIKIAMASPEAKEFLKLSEADQRAAASSDPTARKLYEEKKAIQTAFKTPDLLPDGLDAGYAKSTLGLDLDPASTLNKYNRISEKAREKIFNTQNDAEFNYKAAQYLRDKLEGKIDEFDDIKKQATLAKLYVSKDFSKTTRDLYGLNKTQVYEYITTNKDGKGLADKILALDDALVKAGAISKNKFRHKDGSVAFGPSSGSGGGRSRKGGIDLPSISLADSGVPKASIKLAAYQAPGGSGLKKPGLRIAASKKPAKMTAKKFTRKV